MDRDIRRGLGGISGKALITDVSVVTDNRASPLVVSAPYRQVDAKPQHQSPTGI